MSLENPTPDDLNVIAQNLRFEGHTSRADVIANAAIRLAKLEAVEQAAKEVANYPIMLGDEYPGFIEVLDKLDAALRGDA